MRAVLFVTVVVLVLAALPVGAWASPSLLGPTGLLFIPTADTLGMAQFNAGGTWLTPGGVDESVFFANIGVMPGLEIGATRVKAEGGEAQTLVNAKLRLSPSIPLSLPTPTGVPVPVTIPVPLKLAFAAGVLDLTDQIDQTPYLVASHTLGAGLLPPIGSFRDPRVHLGYATGQIDGVFGGFSVQCSKTTLMAEYDGHDVNVGVKFPLATKLEVTGAALNGLGDYAVGLSVCSPW